MVTTLELQRRGLPYAVVVDGAATPASLQALDRQGLPYLVEVADGATTASRRALEARGLRYLVPVLVDATPASKASLDRQGLRYAVQVDGDILPADRLVLQRQGLACYVEVDSSGNSVSAAAVGGAALLIGEANGFATDFLHPVDAERVALKSSGSTLAYAVDSFFTQSGTSPKMVYDVAGTLVWSPHNLVLNSENLGLWVASEVSASADVDTWPGGSATADRMTTTAGGAYHYYNQSLTTVAGQTYTYSRTVKRDNWDFLFFSMPDDGNLSIFNVATGVFTSVAGGVASTAVDNLGSGWWRVKLTAVATAASSVCSIGIAGTASSVPFSAAGTERVIVGPAQFNRGSTALAYLPTTTAARVGLALDYDPVTHAAKGLLCEPAATNVLLQSAGGRTGFAWTGNGSTYTPAQPDPSGGTEALQVATTANLGINVGSQASTGITAGQVYTGSCWCKGTVGQQIYFYPDSAIASSQVIVTFTGGWQRVSKSFTAVATNAYLTWERFDRIGSAHLPNVTFTVWGGQIETGTVATSYIPTLAATVTRAADSYNCTAASIGYSATVGSWWVETYLLEGAFDRRIIGQNGTTTPLYYNSTAYELSGGAFIYQLITGLIGNVKRGAVAFQAADLAITGDGLAPVTSTGALGTLLSPATIYFGSDDVDPGMIGYIRKVRYLPRRPSNAELSAMTA